MPNAIGLIFATSYIYAFNGRTKIIMQFDGHKLVKLDEV